MRRWLLLHSRDGIEGSIAHSSFYFCALAALVLKVRGIIAVVAALHGSSAWLPRRTVLASLAAGHTPDAILADFPALKLKTFELQSHSRRPRQKRTCRCRPFRKSDEI